MALPVKSMVKGVSPELGEALHVTSSGSVGAVTEMIKESESWSLLLSVTVRIIV